MMLEEALYSYLTSDVGLSALIGVRLYPDLFPENVALPAICYQRISTALTHSRDSGPKLCMTRFQFDVLGADAKGVRQTVIALEAALNGFKGISTPRVDATFLDNDGAQYENQTEHHKATVDALIQYLETFGA